MQRVLSFPTTRGFGDSSEFVTKRMCFSFMFSIGFLALLSGFLLGRFAFDQELTMARREMRQSTQQMKDLGRPRNVSTLDSTAFSKPFSEEALLTHHRDLANTPHSVNASLARAIMLREYLEQSGFEVMSPLNPVIVPLAYTNPNLPNQVVVLDGHGKQVVSFQDSRLPYVDADDKTLQVFLSSAEAVGEPVYVNFGRDEDYLYLDSIGISVGGHVVLVRAGGLSAKDIVATALDHDVAAILIYLDPAQKNVIPELISARELAAIHHEHVSSNSDVADKNFTTPVLVVSEKHAELILQLMAAREQSPASWRGGLNCSYPLGPGFSEPEWKSVVTVNTVNVFQTVYDVVAALKGSQEPDRLVVIGSSLEHWTDGPWDIAGPSALMELSRQLGILKSTKGWMPHRSVAVAFWAQSDEEALKNLLTSQVVAYLNLDLFPMYVSNSTFRGSPLLLSLFDQVASSVLNGIPMEIILPSGSDDDVERMGVPFLKLNDDRYLDNTMEVDYTGVGYLGALWGQMAVRLANDKALPFTLEPFVIFLNHTMSVLNYRFEVVAKRHKLFLETLTESVEELTAAIKTFQTSWRNTLMAQPLQLRRMNDQLGEFSRSLACPRVTDPLSQRAGLLLTRHLLFSQSYTGSDNTAGFGELQDLLRAMTAAAAPSDLQRQIVTLLTDAVRCLKNATLALSDRLDTLVLGKT